MEAEPGDRRVAMSAPTRGAIVLGAGRGERIGGPKALLVLRGEPLALVHAKAALAAGCARVVVVVSPEVSGGLRALPPGVEVAVSCEPDQTGSLRVGLEALGATIDAAIVTPVDVPPASTATVARLFQALDAGALAATPNHAGRGGHPVACATRVLSDLRAHPRPLRDALRDLGPRRVRIEVDDARVTLDFDTPEAWREFAGEDPRFF